jgi:aspartate/methionine/tyrosine aminotransferase
LNALREQVCAFYTQQFQVTPSPHQILITTGASAALTLACLALVESGCEVLTPDPNYPCNRHFIAAADGIATLMDCDASTGFQPTASQVERHWTNRTRGLMVASPANPTGTRINAHALNAIAEVCHRKQGFLIVDEIYQGLVYDRPAETALSMPVLKNGFDDLIVVNSFSKYFGMTGWRLGWMVVPKRLAADFEKLAQNLSICAPTLAQHAALACFSEAALAVCEQRRQEFQVRRDFVLGALERMGLGVPAKPDGAFYVYADISPLSDSSVQWCKDLLEETGVCIVPGTDFSKRNGHRYVRISYAKAMPELEMGMALISSFIQQR